MKPIKIFTVISAVLLLAACSENTLYSWHDYNDALYKDYKSHTEDTSAKLMKQYKKMCEKQKGTRKVVPPGIYAEYGYMLYKQGNTEEAIQYLEKEIAEYPASEAYIGRIINQLKK